MEPRTRILFVRLMLAGAVIVLILAAWYVSDPTFRVYSKSDSPDGRYRCAVIHDHPLQPCFRFALFERGWHWRELPGERGEVNTDSVGLGDVQYTWTGNQVTVTGLHTITGRVERGKQVWE